MSASSKVSFHYSSKKAATDAQETRRSPVHLHLKEHEQEIDESQGITNCFSVSASLKVSSRRDECPEVLELALEKERRSLFCMIFRCEGSVSLPIHVYAPFLKAYPGSHHLVVT